MTLIDVQSYACGAWVPPAAPRLIRSAIDGTPVARAGTGALDPSSRPAGAISFENLSGMGLGDSEVVFSFKVAANRDDLIVLDGQRLRHG